MLHALSLLCFHLFSYIFMLREPSQKTLRAQRICYCEHTQTINQELKICSTFLFACFRFDILLYF
jgi:hypothetical protein